MPRYLDDHKTITSLPYYGFGAATIICLRTSFKMAYLDKSCCGNGLCNNGLCAYPVALTLLSGARINRMQFLRCFALLSVHRYFTTGFRIACAA